MNYLSYRLKLSKRLRELDREKEKYKKRLAEAQQTGNPKTIEQARDATDLRVSGDEIYILMTNYLTSIARKMFIPVPSMPKHWAGNTENDNWEFSNCCGEWLLKPEARADLRSRIRQEKKERREAWMPWIALVIGLIGAITGLIAVIKR